MDEEETVKAGDVNNEELDIIKENNELKVNDIFSLYEELEKKIYNDLKSQFCVFYKRYCVTIQKSRKQGVKRHIDEN